MAITKRYTINDLFGKVVFDNLRDAWQYHPTKRNKDGSRRKLPIVKDPALLHRAQKRNWDLRQLKGAQQSFSNLLKTYDSHNNYAAYLNNIYNQLVFQIKVSYTKDKEAIIKERATQAPKK